MKQVYRLEKLGCASCAGKFERALNGLEGVNSASVNFITGKLTLDADPAMAGEIAEKAAKLLGKIEPGATLRR